MGNDVEIIFEDLRDSLLEALALIEEKAREFEVDLGDVGDDGGLGRSCIADDPLLRICKDFTAKSYRFLCETDCHRNEDNACVFDDLAWYHILVSVKMHRTILSGYDGMIEDMINSLTVAMKSIERCVNALRFLSETETDIRENAGELYRFSRTVKREVKKRYFTDCMN